MIHMSSIIIIVIIILIKSYRKGKDKVVLVLN
jgi:hypothetical protein